MQAPWFANRNRILTVRNVLCAAIVLALAAGASGCSRAKDRAPLISASTTMMTAWQVPQNPLEDHTLGDSPLAQQIRWGYKIFVDTPHEAARFTGGKVSCANCHLNAGQRERALPVVGIAGVFPEYNGRAARLISLADRVVDCFLRSENATGHLSTSGGGGLSADSLPNPTSKEVLAVQAYLAWLSKGYAVGQSPAWRAQNAIARDKLIPVDKLDLARGQIVYTERCQSCHGPEGQGVQIGDKKAGPLWGADSWNDGAGASRVYTLAGIVRYAMPYLDPGSLSDADAQNVAAFINSQPRPHYPFKDRDYVGGKIPVDAVYYRDVNAQRSSATSQP
jgi:thiosulfate dehydrogenase